MRLPGVPRWRPGSTEGCIHKLIFNDEHGKAIPQTPADPDRLYPPAQGTIKCTGQNPKGVMYGCSRCIPPGSDKWLSEGVCYPPRDHMGWVFSSRAVRTCLLPRFLTHAVI